MNKWLAEHVVMWLSRLVVGWEEVFTGREMPTESFSTTDEKEVDAWGCRGHQRRFTYGRGAKEHGQAASVWSTTLESVSSGKGCSGGELHGVCWLKSVDLQDRLRGLSGKTLVCRCGRSGQVPWRHDHRGIRIGSGKAGKGRERFIGGGLGLRQRRDATQVGRWSSRERATYQSYVVKASGVTSSLAAVCALLESGRFAKGDSVTLEAVRSLRRAFGGFGGREVRARHRGSRSGWT